MTDVVVLGSLHLDVMVRAPGRPRLGETVVGDGWALKEGGKGGNQAVAAAAHGASTAMVGLVGDDDFGRRLVANLSARQVDVAAVEARGGAASGMSVAITEPSGDYGAVIVSGVNLHLDAEVVAARGALLSGAKCLVLQNEVPEAANIAAATRATGGRVILNAAPARPLPAGLCANVDILVVNALEAEALAEVPVTDAASAARAAAALLAMVPCAVVTAGGAGFAVASREGLALSIPAHAVELLSTHGAGDVFVGALAARLAKGDALPGALAYANAAAALAVSTDPVSTEGLGPAAVARLLRERP